MMKNALRKQSFGNHAKEYHKYRKEYPPQLHKLLFSLLDHAAAEVAILDIGCGTGKSTTQLITNAPKRLKNKLRILGVDPDSKMLIEARKHADSFGLPITYLKGNAETMDFKKESFDAVIAGTAFHWFATKKAFTNIRRMLKPGGVCMVFWTWKIPKKKKSPGLAQAVFKKYRWQSFPAKWRDSEEVLKLFEKSGFSGFTSVTIPYVERDDLEALVGLCKTVSSYTLLSPRLKKEFLADITSAFRRILGSRRYLRSKRQLRLCYAFK